MSRTPFIAGNWKMNTTREDAVALAEAVVAAAPPGIDVAICPPFPWLIPVADALRGSRVMLGAQNCWTEPAGAFTGEVSPAMLQGLCEVVIIGHSERRHILGESDDLVAKKITAALEAGLEPIVCAGESLDTRQAGEAIAFVRRQLEAAFAGRPAEETAACTIAYEPIWAIGTGVAALPSDAEEMAAAIRSYIGEIAPGVEREMRILYGGSVTAENAAEILAGPNVDGALVGGASLKPDAFAAIMAAAAAD
jgi:triosephosphate isomerase